MLQDIICFQTNLLFSAEFEYHLGYPRPFSVIFGLLILIGALFLVGRRQCNHRNEGILTNLQPFNWRINSAQLKVKLIIMYLSDYHWHCWSTMSDLHIHHVCVLSQLITDILDQPCLIYTFIMLSVFVSWSLTLLINHVWFTHSSCWCTCQLITDIVDQPCLIYTFIMFVYLSDYHWHCWSTMFDLHIHHVGVLVRLSLTFLINHVWSTHSSC